MAMCDDSIIVIISIGIASACFLVTVYATQTVHRFYSLSVQWNWKVYNKNTSI